MPCSKEFWIILLFLKTSSNIQLFWFALLVDHGYTFCDQLAHTWARTAALLWHPSLFLSKHPSFCLNCKSGVFFLHVFHITWSHITGRSSTCVSWRGELHVSDLGVGCPVAASPALTTLTTEQPSKSCALSWAFHVTTALPESYKMKESWCYLRTSWAACEARTGAQLGLTVCVRLVPVHHLKPLEKSLAKGKRKVSTVSLGSQKCTLEPMGSSLCCLWGYCLAWVIIVNSVHGLFFQMWVTSRYLRDIYMPFHCWLSVTYFLDRRSFSIVSVLLLKNLER